VKARSEQALEQGIGELEPLIEPLPPGVVAHELADGQRRSPGQRAFQAGPQRARPARADFDATPGVALELARPFDADAEPPCEAGQQLTPTVPARAASEQQAPERVERAQGPSPAVDEALLRGVGDQRTGRWIRA
jgi:hypothetical protein